MQVLDQSSLTRFGIVMATDILFAATSYAFLILGERFGEERTQGRRVVAYPGAAGLRFPEVTYTGTAMRDLLRK